MKANAALSLVVSLMIACGLMLGLGVAEALAERPAGAERDPATKPAEPGRDKKEVPAVYPVAIFAFQERGSGVKGYGEKISDILFASLATQKSIYLVDRADIKKMLEEQELSLSGIVAPGKATQVSQLTGAKILLTGSVIEVGSFVYIVAKIIGTETSRALGESVKGRTSDDLGSLVEKLAQQVSTTITDQADKLVAKTVKREDRIKTLKERLGNAKRPVVLVRIAERHVRQPTFDPAAQTELMLCCTESGFEVIDPDKGASAQADVIITGEGVSEFATQHGNLISVKSRLELKATHRATGKVLAADRQVTVAVGLAEQITAKSAIECAAMDIAMRMLPKLVAAHNKRDEKAR